MNEPAATTTQPLTVDAALANAARLLANAELEADLKRMERVDQLAASWINIAGLLTQREQNA